MLLKIQFIDKLDATPFKGSKHFAVKNFEILLKKHLYKWEWAIIYDHKKNGQILYYYHHTTGLNRLDKKEYKEALNSGQIHLYIIYNAIGRKDRQTDSGQTIVNSSLEEMHTFCTRNVMQINAYQNNILIKTLKNGYSKKFF